MKDYPELAHDALTAWFEMIGRTSDLPTTAKVARHGQILAEQLQIALRKIANLERANAGASSAAPLTKREQFAAMAMQAHLSNPEAVSVPYSLPGMAADAIRAADFLIAALAPAEQKWAPCDCRSCRGDDYAPPEGAAEGDRHNV